MPRHPRHSKCCSDRFLLLPWTFIAVVRMEVRTLALLGKLDLSSMP